MKLFETVEQYLLIVGINSQQTVQRTRLNVRNVAFFMVFGASIGSSILYSQYEAKNFEEYNLSLYTTATLMCILNIFASFVWNASKIFEIFDKINNMVNKSKL